MANVIIDNSNLTDIANAIRTKKGVETQYKPSEMAAAVASIETFKPEETFNVTPTTSAQTITPTAGHVFSGGTVQAMPNGTMGTVSAAKTISGNTATITPSISAGTAGYNTHAAASGTAVTVQASELVSGTVTVTPKITSQSTDVTNYASVTTNPIYEEISTSAEMDAVIIAANLGKMYKYTGTTDTKYTNGRIYIVDNLPVPVTITGAGRDPNCYIEIDGVKYTTAQTVNTSSSVLLHVNSISGTMGSYTSRIVVDGVTVYSKSTGVGEYTLELGTNNTINLSQSSYDERFGYNGVITATTV